VNKAEGQSIAWSFHFF